MPSPPPPERPSIPTNWDRCLFYVERKGRYCHVRPAEGRQYCGNHMQHERGNDDQDDDGDAALAADDGAAAAATVIKTAEQRVDCPLCHTFVCRNKLNKHLRICPITKKQKIQENQTYFERNVNAGGSGCLWVCEDANVHQEKEETLVTDQESAEWAQSIARRVLEVHQSIFGPLSLSSSSSATTRTTNPVAVPVKVETVTLSDIHNAIPLRDLSEAELKAGMERGLETHHIKTGGARHIPQLASLVGHLRQMQVLPEHDIDKNDNNDGENTTTNIHTAPLILLEMGAGRGMFGLTAAGVACACDNHRKVNLVMVERTGTRAKAEKHLRNKVPQDADMSYMKIDAIQWSRVNCDLAHVSLPTVLHELHTKNGMIQDANNLQPDKKKKKQIIVVIAKHLCGAGTDLALKSMASIRKDVDACLLATCCHGVCDWQHYVGREYLRKVMLKDTEQESSSNNDNVTTETNDDLKKFGRQEFELMSRWCGASVACTHEGSEEGEKSSGVADTEHQQACTSLDDEPSNLSCNISVVVRALNLSCGIQGLGRACQRLIDYGRYEYLRQDVFGEKIGAVVDLNHYAPPEVSPQNAILRAFCCKNEGK